MSESEFIEQASTQGRKRGTLFLAAGGLVLVVAIALGVLFAFKFADSERERDMQDWQVRLGIVADSRLADINDWFEAQHKQLRGIADNTSLQLYLTQLSLFEGDSSQIVDEPAQLTYLRNLLIAEAERGGFTGPVLGAEINANVQRLGIAGIGLIDMNRRPVVATPSMPPLDDRVERALANTPRGERGLIDLYLGVAQTPTMGFVEPIFALQADGDASAQIGWVIGIKEVADELYPLLVQPGATEVSAEGMLLRESSNAVDYLSPLADGTQPLSHTLALSTAELAAAWALATPGGFDAKTDYRGETVLVISRALARAPWTLAYKVDVGEVFVETESRRTRLITVFLLIIGVVAVALVAVWRHGTSRRASEAAHLYRQMADRHSRQQAFLKLIADSQPNEVILLDDQSRYRFANHRAAEHAGMTEGDMLGKTLTSVIGANEAKRFEPANREAMATGETLVREHRIDDEDGGEDRVLQSEHVPLPAEPDQPGRVLMLVQNITDLIRQHEKAERIMRQTVDTLVSVADRRDPYSAYHSSRVAEVAGAIVDEMVLEAVEGQTVEIAAELMNLGKILVPMELLTSNRKLTDEELRQVRESILTSADLIEGIEFEGPVVETLRQMLESWDGTGMPRGLTGEDILRSSRIVAVANAFVGLVSARAYREGMEFDKAIDILLEESGAKFDRRVVSALMNHLDNKGGRMNWAHYRERPSDAPEDGES